MELARAAVEARLAACGQVAGPVASTYWWNDELERAEEWFVFFKLPADRYEALADVPGRAAQLRRAGDPRDPVRGRLTVVPQLDQRRDPAARLRRAAPSPAQCEPGQHGAARAGSPAPEPARGARPGFARADRQLPGGTFQLTMTGSSCSLPRVETVPVSSRNSRPSAGRQAEPARGEHPQHVTVRDQGDVAIREERRGPLEYPVDPLADLLDGLARVAGVAGNDPVPPQRPAGPVPLDLDGRDALVAAVVPFPQVRGRSWSPMSRPAPAPRSAARCAGLAKTATSGAPATRGRTMGPQRRRAGDSPRGERDIGPPGVRPVRDHSVSPCRSKISSPMAPSSSDAAPAVPAAHGAS